MRNLVRRNSVEMAGLLFFVYIGILYFTEPLLRSVSLFALRIIREIFYSSDAIWEEVTDYMIYVNQDGLDTSIVVIAAIAAFLSLRAMSR